MFFWLETWLFQSDREGVVVSWSTKSTTMHPPKHCPYYNEQRAASKDGHVRLSKVPLLWNLLSLWPFLVVFRTLSCSERRSIWSLLFSNLCSALLPRGLPPHGEAPFSEVSDITIIKEMRLNQRAASVLLISVNYVRNSTRRWCFWPCKLFTTLFI